MENNKYIEIIHMINEWTFVRRTPKSHQVAEHLKEVLNESETDFQFRMKLNETLVDENKPSFRR